MEDSVQIRTFTVFDLKEWLLHGNPKEGLSPSIIAPTRAYSILNNPYVNDDMPVVCGLYVDDSLAAFTAVFPEILQRPENQVAWWFTTLWCDPRYKGRGYGLIVIGTLAEALGTDCVFDSEGAPETIEVFKFLGLETEYFQRYIHSEKSINTDSLKGKAAWLLDNLRKCGRISNKKRINATIFSTKYSIVYKKFMDDEAYDFILSHSQDDIMLRSQATFNWILQYPFMQEAPLKVRLKAESAFSSYTKEYQSFLFEVFVEKTLIGVSICVMSEGSFSVKYLYYDKLFSKIVFTAIMEHIISLRVNRFETGDCRLSEFVKSSGLFTKNVAKNISFSHPYGVFNELSGSLQSGDGDMFV